MITCREWIRETRQENILLKIYMWVFEFLKKNMDKYYFLTKNRKLIKTMETIKGWWGKKEEWLLGARRIFRAVRQYAAEMVNVHVHVFVLRCFSRVRLFATLWTVARQGPLSVGTLQARVLESVAMLCSRGSSRPRDGVCLSWDFCIGSRFFTAEPSGKALWWIHVIISLSKSI